MDKLEVDRQFRARRRPKDKEASLPTGVEEAAIAAAKVIIRTAEERGLLDKLRDAFRTKHVVLLMGSTGTGKSQFVSSLQQLMPKAIDRLERTQWARKERLRIDGLLFDFLDTPGHQDHRPRRREAAARASSAKSFGLINVVSWGYHEYATGEAEALQHDSTPDPQWLATHRQIELREAAGLASQFPTQPAFMITLVTKADLWWPHRDEVIDYYTNGSYRDALGDVMVNGHSVLPYSSVFHMFYGKGSMAGTFENADRQLCQEQLLENLLLSTTKLS
jgi:energy-coupling factor transporter ATP-binding protein EcfA2